MLTFTVFPGNAGSLNALIRYAGSDTKSLLYAETSSTRSGLNACRTANSNMIVLPNVMSRPNASLVLVNDRSLTNTNDAFGRRSEEHTSELQSRSDLVCRLLLEKKKTEQQQGHWTG